MEKVLKAKEMNQFLKRRDSTIYKLVSKGAIPGVLSWKKSRN
jgi:predicted DNA-binding transcriptional regulator AlpA